MSMSNPVIGIHAPDLKDRVKEIAQRMGISMSDLGKQLLEPQVDRIEREWARMERRMNRVAAMSDAQLEDEENRLLDRLSDLSEPEEAYLNAVQDELTARSKPAHSKAAA